MPGYIDNSVADSLWGSYNVGRAGPATHVKSVLYGQWSALMDNTTCDWCGWADERIFDTRIEPYSPPMHFGCRCIIGYIRRDEFSPGSTWGAGPPKSSFPPGSSGGYRNGKPTLRNQPPKNASALSPNKAELDRAVDEHRGMFDDRSAAAPEDSEAGAWDGYERFVDWHKDSLKTVSGIADDKFDEAYDFLNQITIEWSRSSSKLLADIWETAVSGQTDDLLKLLRASANDLRFIRRYVHRVDQGLLATDDIAKIFQAQRELTVAVEGAKNIEIVLYRGVESTTRLFSGESDRAIGLYNFKSSVVAGDLEQSLGTNFIESWSLSVDTAKDFSNEAGMIFKKVVDPDDLLLSVQTHPGLQGHATEREFLWQNFDGTVVPKLVDTESVFNRTVIEVW